MLGWELSVWEVWEKAMFDVSSKQNTHIRITMLRCTRFSSVTGTKTRDEKEQCSKSNASHISLKLADRLARQAVFNDKSCDAHAARYSATVTNVCVRPRRVTATLRR